MKIEIEITEEDLKQLILTHLQEKFLNHRISIDDVKIETKSKQNYRAEWETAAFRARVTQS